MSVRDRVLGTHTGYSSFLKLIRADRFLSTVARDIIHLEPGQRLLDLACGTGQLSQFIGTVDYTGIDHNPSYIANAQHRFGGLGRRFVCAELTDLVQTESGTYDVVSAVSALHHLDDELAVDVIRTALSLLAPGGRLISIDPVFHPDQRTTARVLMGLDRGRFVRHPEHYLALAHLAGAVAQHHVRFDMNPFPYTHFIMELSPQAAAEAVAR
ncbi:MAG: class I SAM-dependent methyltransferase [Ilumatobacteraceae bacterium]